MKGHMTQASRPTDPDLFRRTTACASSHRTWSCSETHIIMPVLASRGRDVAEGDVEVTVACDVYRVVILHLAIPTKDYCMRKSQRCSMSGLNTEIVHMHDDTAINMLKRLHWSHRHAFKPGSRFSTTPKSSISTFIMVHQRIDYVGKHSTSVA